MKNRALILALALLVTQLVVATGRAATPVPTLGSSVRVESSRTGYSLVRLDRKLSIDAIKSDIFGVGPVVGFVLVRDGVPAEDTGVYEHVRIDPCYITQCDIAPYDNRAASGPASAGRNLDPGLYRLYVIASDKPVRVEIRTGLPGAGSSFRPTHQAPSSSVSLVPNMSSSPNGVVTYSAGALPPATSTSHGLSIISLWGIGHSERANTITGDCYYYDKDPPPEPIAFLPGCPTGYGTSGVDSFSRSTIGETSIAFFYPKGLGAWYATPGPVDQAVALGFWMPYLP